MRNNITFTIDKKWIFSIFEKKLFRNFVFILRPRASRKKIKVCIKFG
jgi:hypothetical protein